MGGIIDGKPVLGGMQELNNQLYDRILVASLTGMSAIRQDLLDAGVDSSKIVTDYVQTRVEARINFLRDYAELVGAADTRYSVAEGGVFQGDFSKEINRYFPNSKLFLFDTFEGFHQRDLNVEAGKNWSKEKAHHLNTTSVDLVMSKLPDPGRAVIRKGYFPDTAKGLEHEEFIFVNLDFDLYQPIIEGLGFFIPRMCRNAVVLVHDYYNPGYPGVKAAVEDYEKETGRKMLKLPIGDHCSIAIPMA